MKKLITEVKFQTSKIGIIQILNTILNNVGDFRHIEETDSWEMIVNTAEYINSNYSINMLHLVDWETCKTIRKFSPKQMRKRLNSISKITQLIYGVDNNYYLEIVVDYSDYNYWGKVMVQYPNCTLVLDNYIYEDEHDDYANKGKTPLNSVILSNKQGEVSILQVESDKKALKSLSPIHFGYVHLLKLYSDIILFQESLFNRISSEIYEKVFPVLQEYYNKEYQIWMDYKYKECAEKNITDCFSIFHTHDENKIIQSWKSFFGEYCSMSECYTAHYIPLSYKEKKCKEVVLQPLWK